MAPEYMTENGMSDTRLFLETLDLGVGLGWTANWRKKQNGEILGSLEAGPKNDQYGRHHYASETDIMLTLAEIGFTNITRR